MNTIFKILTITIFLLFGFESRAKSMQGNPIIPNIGMADPHIYIFENRAYLYATRDADSTAQNFIMPEWNIWSSDDLINWKHERTIDPKETYMGASVRCWAPDIAYRKGAYYFYFSNGNVNTGVMRGTTPSGPFVDALGKPMLDEDLTETKEYDPSILVVDDEDQTAYIVFGHHRDNEEDHFFAIARLSEDMISLDEEPKEIIITGDQNVLKGNDKPNLHKHNGIYYLSAGTHYATSKNVYGPYVKTGDTGNGKFGLDSRAHGNFFKWNGQWFHTWCHFHLGKDVARYRESYISYLHYKDNGEILTDTVFLNRHFSTGVGQYDASWDKIEAEWFMAASGVEKRESINGGFEIQQVTDNGYLCFPNIQNLKNVNSMKFYIASEKGGTIEVREGSVNGSLLGSLRFSKTGGMTKYQEITGKISNLNQVKDICLVFKGKHEDILHLDWFSFETK